MKTETIIQVDNILKPIPSRSASSVREFGESFRGITELSYPVLYEQNDAILTPYTGRWKIETTETKQGILHVLYIEIRPSEQGAVNLEREGFRCHYYEGYPAYWMHEKHFHVIVRDYPQRTTYINDGNGNTEIERYGITDEVDENDHDVLEELSQGIEVTYTDDHFVAETPEGNILTSNDGITWVSENDSQPKEEPTKDLLSTLLSPADDDMLKDLLIDIPDIGRTK